MCNYKQPKTKGQSLNERDYGKTNRDLKEKEQTTREIYTTTIDLFGRKKAE